VAPGAGGVVGAEGGVGAVGTQQRGHLDHRAAAAAAASRSSGRRADVPQRVAVLAVERRAVPRRHGARGWSSSARDLVGDGGGGGGIGVGAGRETERGEEPR
jgi:hypothetical protein